MFSILYVDDEPALLEIGKLFLEERGGFAVETVTSAPKALLKIAAKKYDAIISDYHRVSLKAIFSQSIPSVATCHTHRCENPYSLPRACGNTNGCQQLLPPAADRNILLGLRLQVSGQEL
jgi:DNA-binding NarL/FixJ family response regulator